MHLHLVKGWVYFTCLCADTQHFHPGWTCAFPAPRCHCRDDGLTSETATPENTTEEFRNRAQHVTSEVLKKYWIHLHDKYLS